MYAVIVTIGTMDLLHTLHSSSSYSSLSLHELHQVFGETSSIEHSMISFFIDTCVNECLGHSVYTFIVRLRSCFAHNTHTRTRFIYGAYYVVR